MFVSLKTARSSITCSCLCSTHRHLHTTTYTVYTPSTCLNPTMHSSEPCALRQVPSAGRIADTKATTGYEPTESTAIDPTQSFFRRVRTTSIFGSAGNLATDPLDVEINDEQTTDLLASPLVLTGATSGCRPIASLSLAKRTHLQTSIQYGETCSFGAL